MSDISNNLAALDALTSAAALTTLDKNDLHHYNNCWCSKCDKIRQIENELNESDTDDSNDSNDRNETDQELYRKLLKQQEENEIEQDLYYNDLYYEELDRREENIKDERYESIHCGGGGDWW
jgi:hypothetical protein